MRHGDAGCTLALDLGTTAFKAAAIGDTGICGSVTVVPYALEYGESQSVTCEPELYVRCAFRALRGAVRSAQAADLKPTAIGLASQAQTFVPVDERDRPVASAVVWTDATASAEALKASEHLPEFAATSGFVRPSPLQFLPKLMRYGPHWPGAARYLLLNEWIIHALTGECYGDTNIQGMGGFYDISRRQWNEKALDLAGISPSRLAPTGPAASITASVTREACRRLGLHRPVPVYSCGNDQSCAAIGAGLARGQDVYANFGTAMVVYALTDRPAPPASEDHIAGISPLEPWFFRLGVESECGNILEWLATLLFRREGIARMLDEALSPRLDSARLPEAEPTGGGSLELRGLRVGMGPAQIARALLERYSARFAELLDGAAQNRPRHVFAGGGLSRCKAWLEFLSRRHGVEVSAVETEHPGLIGVERVIAQARTRA